MHRLRTFPSVAAGLAVTLAASSYAQPDPSDRPERPPRNAERTDRGEARPDWDEAALRERLQRRLDESERATDRLREAIARLDAGDAGPDVARELGREFLQDRGRDGRRGMQGAPRGGPRDRGEGFAPWRGRPEPISDAERAELRAFVQEHLPRLHDRMTMMAERNPEAAAAGLARLAPRLRDIQQGFDGGPVGRARLAEFQAGMDVIDAGRELRSAMRRDASEEDIASARASLRSAVEAGYDARLAVAEAEIIELEARVNELRERLADATSNRDADVAQKVDELAERMQAEAAKD